MIDQNPVTPKAPTVDVDYYCLSCQAWTPGGYMCPICVKDTRTPGSREAVAWGCACPVLDNKDMVGLAPPQFYVSARCGMHWNTEPWMTSDGTTTAPKPLEPKVGPDLDKALAEALGGRYFGGAKTIVLGTPDDDYFACRNSSTDPVEAFKLAMWLRSKAEPGSNGRGWEIRITLRTRRIGISNTIIPWTFARAWTPLLQGGEEVEGESDAEVICRSILAATEGN